MIKSKIQVILDIFMTVFAEILIRKNVRFKFTCTNTAAVIFKKNALKSGIARGLLLSNILN